MTFCFEATLVNSIIKSFAPAGLCVKFYFKFFMWLLLGLRLLPTKFFTLVTDRVSKIGRVNAVSLF